VGLTELIYLDTFLVIYFVEEHQKFGPVVTQAIADNADKCFCISPLVELECLVVPMREGRQSLIHRYDQFFQDYVRLEMNAAIFRHAAKLRARYNLKTPDALHLGTATCYGCAEF
jgi:uncharacterized protein